MSCRRVQKESDESIVYGLVARYGPQSVASTQVVKETEPRKIVSFVWNYN